MSTNANPTPGEWFTDLKFLDPRIMGTHAATGETFVIAKVITYIGAEDESKANAHLLAASRELLAQAKKLEQICYQVISGQAPTLAHYDSIYDGVKRSIAKAEGRQP